MTCCSGFVLVVLVVVSLFWGHLVGVFLLVTLVISLIVLLIY